MEHKLQLYLKPEGEKQVDVTAEFICFLNAILGTIKDSDQLSPDAFAELFSASLAEHRLFLPLPHQSIQGGPHDKKWKTVALEWFEHSFVRGLGRD